MEEAPSSHGSVASAASDSAVSFPDRLARGVPLQDLHWARVSQWYPAFRKATMATEAVPLPPAFLAYMRASGSLVLPACPPDMLLHPTDPRFEAAPPDFDETGYHDRGSSEESWGDSDGGDGGHEGDEEEANTDADAEAGGGAPSREVSDGRVERRACRKQVCFADLEQNIRGAISRLGGQAFCRSDWTSANDVRR
jgi:hypothetical protein